MEKRDYTELQELHELREQVSLLKNKLREQKLINERAILLVTQKGIKRLNRTGVIWSLFSLFAVVYCSWAFHHFGFSDGFVVGTAIFLAVCAVVTMYAHWRVHSLDVAQGNLLEITQRLLSFRKIYSHWHIFSIPALLIWCYFLYVDAQRMLDNAEGFLIAGAVGGAVGGAFGLWRHYKTLRETDAILANIKDLSNTREV